MGCFWMAGAIMWVDMAGGNKAKFGHYRGLRIDFRGWYGWGMVGRGEGENNRGKEGRNGVLKITKNKVSL